MKTLKTLTTVATLALAASAAHSADLPNEEYAYLGVATLDMLTTLDIKHHHDMWEINPVMGRHPSDAKVLTYFAVTDLLHAGITYELVEHNAPKALVKGWEYFSIGFESGYVAHNLSMGLRFSF